MNRNPIPAAINVLLAGATLFFGLTALADVRLPAVIGDHMVLQQKCRVPLWGWAQPGEKVEVKASWARTGKSVSADRDGRWKISLKTPAAGGPFSLEINGLNKITLTDILVGEVWLCSGQSNMQMSLAYPKPGYSEPVLNYQEEIKQADCPQIRLFTVSYNASDSPVDDCKGSWKTCRPEVVGDFSAIGYFFGRQLQQRLKVPVGLINASQGASALETWVSPEVLKGDKEYRHILERYEYALKNLPAAQQKYRDDLAAWQNLGPAEQAKVVQPWSPYGERKHCAPATLYNGMINPLIPFPIRGVIFYQGEENAIWTGHYQKLFADLIRSWREAWDRPEMFFAYAQLSSFDVNHLSPLYQYWVDWHKGSGDLAQLTDETWAEVQEAQLRTLLVPHTGMAVTLDIGGDSTNIHPPNKQEVARRLSLWALAGPYKQQLVRSGPIYKSMRREDDKVVIGFEKLESPLRSEGGEFLAGFQVAGPDRVFQPAEARIKGDKVVVWSVQVRDPVAVRYAWGSNPLRSLCNEKGLPASPFRTDDW